MNSKKIFYAMLGALGLLVILNGLVVGLGTSMMGKASQQLVSLKLDHQVLEDQQTALIKAQKDISQYTDLDLVARAIVPQDKDQAKAVREITKYASDLKIPIQYISFPNSTLGAAAALGLGAATKAAPAITQVQPVLGIPKVFQLQINVQSDLNQPVSFSQLIKFLQKLELSRRTSQVTGINVTPDTKNRDKVTFSLVLNLYLKP